MQEQEDLADWCERNWGRVLLSLSDDVEGTLRAYSQSDGIGWLTLELPDGSTRDCRRSDVELVDASAGARGVSA